MTLVGVVMPTVLGREADVKLALASHAMGDDVVFQVIHDKPTCGEAWNEGAALLLAAYPLTHLMFSADDLVARPGWLAAALDTLRMGYLPAPVLWDKDGGVWAGSEQPGELVSFSRVPFMPVSLYRMLPPCPAIHYFSDCWYGDRSREQGWEIMCHAGYAFIHTWAQVGRIDMQGPHGQRDHQLYVQGQLDNPYRDLEARQRRRQ